MIEPDLDQTQVECSVLVPVLNERRSIEEAVASMRRQRLAGDVEFLLIDGGSTDGTREILERLALQDERIRLFDNPAGSTPISLNIGLSHARGRWVARMDAHSHYPDDYLARGIERLSRGDTPWVSGPMVPVGINSVSRAVALALATRLGRGGGRRWAAAGGSPADEYDLDSGVFCGIWSRKALFEVGGWDERWLRNQDSEMAGRFLASGERLVCLPRMAAQYIPRTSIRRLWRQYRLYGEYRVKTAARHPRTMRRSHLLLPALVLCPAAAFTPWPLKRPARAVLGAYGMVLGSAGAAAARKAEPPWDAALVPAVLMTMHAGHGVGFWLGVLRHGIPADALRNLAGLDEQMTAPLQDGERVFAPSLASGRQEGDVSGPIGLVSQH